MPANIDVWKAMADPVRREILLLLSSKALTATEIAEQTKGTFANTSQHLKILAQSGLVQMHQKQKFRIFTLNGSVATSALQWLSKICITPIQSKIMLDHKIDSL